MTRCDLREYSECACPAGECDDQSRHQRIADLFAREKAEMERYQRGTRIIVRGICIVSVIAFIGIFYAAGLRADDGFRKQALISQEQIAWKR